MEMPCAWAAVADEHCGRPVASFVNYLGRNHDWRLALSMAPACEHHTESLVQWAATRSIAHSVPWVLPAKGLAAALAAFHGGHYPACQRMTTQFVRA